jgi:hypothetical protein
VNALAGLAMLLRMQAAANVEYSMDARPDAAGITVPLGAHACARLHASAAQAGFAGDWATSAQRLIDAILPDALLLRLDSVAGRLDALTVYLRFPTDAKASVLAAQLGRASRLQVEPGPLAALTAVLGCDGARGIGLRIGPGGQRLAVYFKVERDLQAFSRETVGRLLGQCGWDDANALAIAADLRELHPGGSVGVIGVDLDGAGHIASLKCDPANVPLARAEAFLRAKNAPLERIGACSQLAQLLRAKSLSYVGVKYGRDGFAGWRLYFSFRPCAAAGVGQPTLLTDAPRSASLRMPHY